MTQARESAQRAAVAQVLRDLASALKLAGEKRFRVAAYERAAEAIAAFSWDLDRLAAEGRLTELPAVGPRLAAVIGEVLETGSSSRLAELTRDLPTGALALARGPKLSLRAIRTLSEAGIRDLDALRRAAQNGGLRALRGFSPKREAKLLAAMQSEEARRGRTILRDALEIADNVVRFLSHHAEGAEGLRVEAVGEVRRGHEVVEAIELLAASADPSAVLARFEGHPRLVAVDSRDEARVTARWADGERVVLHAVKTHEWSRALQRLTGSAAHVAAFEDAAARAPAFAERAPSAGQEEELYALAGLQYVPAELREGVDEIALAARHRLPRLIEPSDVQGIVHCHTDYSDGRHTIAQMAEAAEKLGMKYVTITDHSPTAHYAGGVDVERLRRQWDEIARVQETVSVRILRGTESDILEDGALDYPDAILEQLDVVIASIHNRYGLDERSTTRRILRALRHPVFKIWGHPLGRLLLRRPPVACDVERILDAAAEERVAIEINGDPYRLDLEPRYVRLARERRIPFVVSVDAHATRELNNLRFGITMARRGGLTAEDVLNTRDADGFAAFVRPWGGPGGRERR